MAMDACLLYVGHVALMFHGVSVFPQEERHKQELADFDMKHVGVAAAIDGDVESDL